MTKREFLIMKLHRERINAAPDFETFKQAQLRFVDWILENYEGRDKVEEIADDRFVGDTLS